MSDMANKVSGIPRLGIAAAPKNSRTSGIPTVAGSRIPGVRKPGYGTAVENNVKDANDSDPAETKEGKITSQSVDLAKKRTVLASSEVAVETPSRIGKPNKSAVIITKGEPTRIVPKEEETETTVTSYSQEFTRDHDATRATAKCDAKGLSTFKHPAENQGACGKDNCDSSRDRTSATIRECVMKDRTSKSSFILHLPAEDQETLEKTLKVRSFFC